MLQKNITWAAESKRQVPLARPPAQRQRFAYKPPAATGTGSRAEPVPGRLLCTTHTAVPPVRVGLLSKAAPSAAQQAVNSKVFTGTSVGRL